MGRTLVGDLRPCVRNACSTAVSEVSLANEEGRGRDFVLRRKMRRNKLPRRPLMLRDLRLAVLRWSVSSIGRARWP
jgi:hypothetical protein